MKFLSCKPKSKIDFLNVFDWSKLVYGGKMFKYANLNKLKHKEDIVHKCFVRTGF